MQNENIRKRD